MKNIFSVCFLLFICLQSCGPDANDTEAGMEAVQDSLASENGAPIADQAPLPPPVISEKKKEVIDDQLKDSPFKNMGCCADEYQTNKDACCCSEVILSYKKMVASKKKGLGKLKDTDPILSHCRNLRKKEFDEIDNPPLPPSSKKENQDMDGI